LSAAFGDDEIISKNNETINNPAIAAPIIITLPFQSCPFSCTQDSSLTRLFPASEIAPYCPGGFWCSVILTTLYVSTDAPGCDDVAVVFAKFV
jgi:hypothetical protein